MSPTLLSGATFAFRVAVERFAPALPVLILGHNHADGLSATTSFARASTARGQPACTCIVDSLPKLRLDQMRCAPDAPARFGMFPAEAKALDAETAAQEAAHDLAGDADVNEAA